MHEIIKDHLSDQFAQSERAARDISRAHLAYFLALESPYMNGSPHTEYLIKQLNDDYFVVGQERQGNFRSVSLVDDFFDMYGSDECDLPDFPKAKMDKVVDAGEVPSDLWRDAEEFLKSALPGSTHKTLFSPSENDFLLRDKTFVTKLTNETLDDFLGNLLNPNIKQYDQSLANYGIKYHYPTNWGRENWVYFVAHNENTVAGILGAVVNENDAQLSYVSVAPAFRRQGVSQKLYQELIKICLEKELILVRSTPSDMTRDLGITPKYTKILDDAGVVHCRGGTYAEHAFLRAKENGCAYNLLVPFSKEVARDGEKNDFDRAQRINSVWKPRTLAAP